MSGDHAARSVEERLDRLEQEVAIRKLKSVYAGFCDDSYDPDKVLSLCSDDCSWESNAFGSYFGRQEVYDFFASLDGMMPWAKHIMTNPTVELAPSGDSARAHWYLLVLCSMSGASEDNPDDAVVMCGTYNDDLVREGGEWKFQRILIELDFVSDLNRGWVEQRFRGEEGVAQGGRA